MKKCPWCGKDYPDEAIVCEIDQHPLDTIHTSCPTTEEEIGATQQLSNPVRRSAIVSGVIFLLGAFRIIAFAQGPWDAGMLMMLASILTASVVAIGVVFVLSRRNRTQWSWLRVLTATLLSYFGFGVLCLVLAIVLGSFARRFHL